MAHAGRRPRGARRRLPFSLPDLRAVAAMARCAAASRLVARGAASTSAPPRRPILLSGGEQEPARGGREGGGPRGPAPPSRRSALRASLRPAGPRAPSRCSLPASSSRSSSLQGLRHRRHARRLLLRGLWRHLVALPCRRRQGARRGGQEGSFGLALPGRLLVGAMLVCVLQVRRGRIGGGDTTAARRRQECGGDTAAVVRAWRHPHATAGGPCAMVASSAGPVPR
ncbi:hypothetical protein PVAP13_7NG202617 [Panicum virgatum]|uniref:Uncharacterized protein n=1 Tax=Panicum virgatum TaxID=38727 RepID=A0A8T0Q0X6_PANVG|nr:hypothetical protein PVAP13_7NG202617 [Panicum virgatum]